MNNKTYLEQYYEAVKTHKIEINGEWKYIIVGQEMLQALEMYVADLDNPKYIYDTRKANRCIEFIERFCKLTKSPFYGKPVKLMLWQKAFIETLYSFKKADSGNERFKKVLMLIGRKNTKSETCDFLALAEFILGNDGSDIVCSSNDDTQANILYDGINTMRAMFDPRNKRTHKNLSFMLNKKNGSKIFKLSDKTRNKEGRNIDFAIIDEVHEMKDKTIINSIDQSQSLKDNPKRIIISTEGFVSDGALDEELRYARQVLNGEIEDDTILIWLYTQDSEQEIWEDEQSWQKSNPTLIYGIKKWDYLRERINKSRIDKSERVFTLCKDFNIPQKGGAEAWLMLEDVENEETFDLEDFRGSYCLAGIDMSETTDLTACSVLLMKPNDDKMYIYTKYFLPENKIHSKEDNESGANYVEWLRQGLIIPTGGSENDLTKVADWLYSLYKQYDIKLFRAGYDQRFCKDFLKRMEEYYYPDTCEIVWQNKVTLSNAMKLVEAELKAKNINYNNNPILKWNLLNCSMEMDRLGQIIAVKINNIASKRIDGAVATIICMEMFRRYRTEFKQMIDRR